MAIAVVLALTGFVVLMTTGIAPRLVDTITARVAPRAPSGFHPAPEVDSTPSSTEVNNAHPDFAPIAEGPVAEEPAGAIEPAPLQLPSELRPELATPALANPQEAAEHPSPPRETLPRPEAKAPAIADAPVDNQPPRSRAENAPPPAVARTPQQPDSRSGFEKINDDARQFVRDYLAAAEKPQPGSEVALYADEVDYFAQGRLSRKAIEADQRNYYRKWPKRDFVLLDEPQVVEIGHAEVVVKFRIKYDVRNGSQTAQGVTENTVRLKRLGPKMRITAIRERKI